LIDSTAGNEHGRHAQSRFALTFLLTVSLGLLALIGFNFAVNPFGYYPTLLVRRPATGQDRRVKMDLLREYSGVYGTAEDRGGPVDAIIVGSSRVMTLAPETLRELTGLRTFNAGFSDALPEDYYAVLNQLIRRGTPPKEIVLGIDIIAFDPGPVNQFSALTPELASSLPRDSYLPGLVARAKSLLSYGQTRRGVDLLLQNAGRKPPEPWPVAFDADGLLHYVEWEIGIAQGTFVPEINPDVGGGRLEELDDARRACFERFLTLARENGVRVRAFLTPYHPAVLAYRAVDEVDWFGERRAAVAGYLQGLEKQYPGFTFDDFTDIEAFGGASDEFFDSVHYFSSNGDRLLAALYRMTE